jgi:EAL domain-containing protein (putative c-di-GMP-specific phosphodiesterase class I)
MGERSGFQVVAEGVETVGQLDTLRRLGVHAAQGFYLGRPGPLPVKEPA